MFKGNLIHVFDVSFEDGNHLDRRSCSKTCKSLSELFIKISNSTIACLLSYSSSARLLSVSSFFTVGALREETYPV